MSRETKVGKQIGGSGIETIMHKFQTQGQWPTLLLLTLSYISKVRLRGTLAKISCSIYGHCRPAQLAS